jgi:hypothetical protein
VDLYCEHIGATHKHARIDRLAKKDILIGIWNRRSSDGKGVDEPLWHIAPEYFHTI